MRVLAITNRGIESVSALEIGELIRAKTQILEEGIIFEAKRYEELFLLCYKAQSLRKVLLLLYETRFKELKELEKGIKNLDIREWLGRTFVVRSLVRNNPLQRQEVEAQIGEYILEKTKAKVDLEGAETTFFVFINRDRLFFGVDFGTEDLGNRDYRIFVTKEAVKPNVAYALVRKSGWKKDETLLDPFCLSGTISIEAALYATNTSQHYYNKEKFLFRRLKRLRSYNFQKFFDALDKDAFLETKGRIIATDSLFHNINAAKKNAKIAGINKAISFSKQDIDWIDVKFEKESINCIAAMPPSPTRLNQQAIKKLYRDFFHQAEYVLKKDGKIALFVDSENNLIEEAATASFKILNKEQLWQGKKEYKFLILILNRLCPESR